MTAEDLEACKARADAAAPGCDCRVGAPTCDVCEAAITSATDVPRLLAVIAEKDAEIAALRARLRTSTCDSCGGTRIVRVKSHGPMDDDVGPCSDCADGGEP